MPFIIVNLQGQASAGGYLKIDGERALALYDDMLIPVPTGHHYLEFSSQSPSARTISNLNVAVGNYKTAAFAERNAVDGNISEHFPENGVMYFTVISDARGHILDLPKYNICEVEDEEIERLTDLYQKRSELIRAAEEEELAEQGKHVGMELLLCTFLGWAGAHKFYRKKYGMGVLYLLTFGLFGIGSFIDWIKLLIIWFKTRK